MNCPRCGVELPENATFCTECGFDLSARPDENDAKISPKACGNPADDVPDDGGERSDNAPARDADNPGDQSTDSDGESDTIPAEDDGPVGMKVRFTPYYDEELAREQASSFEADPEAEHESSPFVPLAAGYGTIADGSGARPGLELSDEDVVDPRTNTLPAPAPPVSAPPRKKRVKPVAAVIIVAVVAAAVIAGLVLWSNANQTSDAPFVGKVEVALEIPGYDEGSSPVPIKVSGTTSAQEPLLETFLITPTSNAIELEEGRYHFSAGGSPVTGGGIIFGVPREDYEVTVGPDGTRVNGKTAPGPTFTYAALAAENVTDQAVANIRAWMTASGIPEDSIEAYSASVYAARDARIAQIEEERRVAAEEKAAAERLADLKAAAADYGIARTEEADGFSFGMPAVWSDRVESGHYADGEQSVTVVHLAGNPDLKVMEIARYPIADGQSRLLGNNEGDGAEMETVSSWDSENWRFEVRACEWPRHFMEDGEYMGCSYDAREALVRMCTGNRYSFDDLGLLEPWYYEGAAADMVRNAVVPTIVSQEPHPEAEGEAAPEAGANPEDQGPINVE